MNISSDGVTVRFKTESRDLFMAEKSGAKPNTVRILDYKEYQQLKKADPKKISILHHREIILRTITHIYVTEVIFGNMIVVFSWTHENHAMHSETNHRPGDHNMILDPAELCRRIDTSQRAILLPGALIQQLQDADLLSSLPAFISKMLEEHHIKRAEERGARRDPIPIAKTMRCPDCDGDLLKSRAGEFGECIICGALYRLDQDKGDKLIATIKLLKCPHCDGTGSILLLKTREGDKASKYGKCYKCGTEYRLDQRGNFYHG